MDVIIQAIIWLLKNLFGEQEAPADMSRPPQRERRTTAQRGPYNYGDQSSSGGTRPKTLEEILAEVRREAGQKSAPVQPPVVEEEPEPRPRPSIGEALPSERTALPSERQAEPPVIKRAPPRRAPMPQAPVPRPEPAPHRWATKEPPEAIAHPASKPLIGRDLQPIPDAQAAEELQDRSDAREEARAHRTRRRTRDEATASAQATTDVLHSLRNATGSAKVTAARQAFLMAEILGRPRALRRWHPMKRN